MSEPFDGFEHKVNVLLLHGLVGDNAPEEVGELSERLVADHDRALGHHAGFDGGSHLKKEIVGLVQWFPNKLCNNLCKYTWQIKSLHNSSINSETGKYYERLFLGVLRQLHELLLHSLLKILKAPFWECFEAEYTYHSCKLFLFTR